MPNARIGPFVALAASLLASPVLGSDAQKSDRAAPHCFNASTIRDFRVIDSRHVFLVGRHRQGYLATLFNRCTGLGFADTLAFDSPNGRLCETGGDAILYQDRRCVIDKIERVENFSAAKDLVERRREQPSNEGDSGTP